jgi:hypothetical protein
MTEAPWMASEIIWNDKNTQRKITRSDAPSGQSLRLLDSTVWGSRDTRYRILGIEKKLARLRAPSYFVLSESGHELCVFALDYCFKQVAGSLCGAYHFVMASTLPDRQNEGLAGLLIDHVRDFCLATVGTPGFGFAYVEETTEFSLKLSSHIGHSIEATIPLTLFTRLFPRRDPNVGLLEPEETGDLIKSLETLYSDHELADFATSLRQPECLVYRRNGKIIAAAQTEVLTWRVVSLPGAVGAALQNILPRVPGLNRMLDLQNLRIVRLGNLLVPEGSEPDFFSLIETCLSHHDARIGLILLDERSPVLDRLRGNGRFGMLSRAMNGSAKLHIDVVGMNDVTIGQLSSRPLLVSPADVF